MQFKEVVRVAAVANCKHVQLDNGVSAAAATVCQAE
jgi:hypothetical protein